MKKLIMIIIITSLLTGYAMADTGIPAVPETQGITTSTTLDALGNFASATDIQWRITDDDLTDLLGQLFEGTLYDSVYTEETQSNGVGLIAYDKELDVETSDQLAGQWNIEAVKELEFVGIDGARVMSSDTIYVDSVSLIYDWPDDVVLCPFIAEIGAWIPSYCNNAEAGSTIDMTVANVRTTSTDRFIMDPAEYPVELNHDILVTELITGLPSSGTASAFMNILIQEGYGSDDPGDWEVTERLGERIELTEETTVHGDITVFEKLMHYESGFIR